MAAITAREFLRKNGFTVGDRGRFNQLMLQFLKDKGFDVTVPTAKPKNETVAVETEGSKIRQWARDNGIEVNARGKLSTALKAAYAANDATLVTIEIKNEPKTKIAKPVSTGQVAKATINKPVVRDISVAYAIDARGVAIAFGTCGKCNETVSRCIDELPSIPRFMAKLDESFTVQLNRPEKLRHESLTLPSL